MRVIAIERSSDDSGSTPSAPASSIERCWVSANRVDANPSTAASGVASAHRIASSRSSCRSSVHRRRVEVTRPVEQPDRLAVGVQPLGMSGGTLVPDDRVVGLSTAVVVACDLAADRVRVALVETHQCVGDHPVVAAAGGWAQRVVGDVADLAVGEVVGVDAVLADDAPPPQFVESPHECELVDARVLPASTAAVNSRPTVAAMSSSSRPEADSWRKRALITACSLGVISDAAAIGAVPAGAHGLDDEQRVSFGVGVEIVDHRRIDGRSGK